MIDYFIERFYPLFSFLVIAGITQAGNGSPFVFIGLFLIAFLLRLKNDIDDVEHDKIAFPERPIPRGSFPKKSAETLFQYNLWAVALYFLAIFIFYGWSARLLSLASAVFLWFLIFIPAKNRFIEIGLQQLLVIPLALLAISIGRPDRVLTIEGISYAILLCGAFATFQICRKLNPQAHPASMTFVQFYGYQKAYWVAVCGLILSAIGAYFMGVQVYLWPCEGGVLLLLTLLFMKPAQYLTVRNGAALSLLAHSWAFFLVQ